MKALELIRKKISWKSIGSSIFLVFNSFVWYIFVYQIMSQIIDEGFYGQNMILLYLSYYACLAITAIIGAKIIPKFRAKAMVFWMLFGASATYLLNFITIESFFISAIITGILGISVGIGLPSCLSFFAGITKIENRSFAGGIVWGLVGIFVLGFAFLFAITDLFEFILIMCGWRFLGILIFKLLNKSYKPNEVEKAPSYFSLIKDRKIQLYLFPWIMFCIINFAEAPMVNLMLESTVGLDFMIILQLTTWSLVGIFAIIGGYVADIVGRKRVIISGFVMLGIEYATMSYLTWNVFASIIFIILDGVSWGLLFSVFFTSLWGDLGEYYVKEKYYVLGGLPYLLANFLYVLISPITDINNSPTAFTIASFFLFLAILPLIYTTETLPEIKIKERELINYLENAQKIKDKYS